MDRHQQAFLEEARDLLGDLEEALLSLEHEPQNPELVGRVFRAMHTIKGSSAMFGFEAIESFTHDIESAFDMVREGVIPVTPDLISLTLQSRDHIAALLACATNGQAPDSKQKSDGEKILQELRAFMPAKAAPPASDVAGAVHAPVETALPVAVEVIRVRFRPPTNIYLRGLDPHNIIDELSAMGKCADVKHELPVPPETDPDLCYAAWDILLSTSSGIPAVRDVFIFVEDDSELRFERLADATGLSSDMWNELLETLRKSVDVPLETLLRVIHKGGQAVAHVKEESPGIQDARPSQAKAIQSIKVPADRLDKLVNLVGELVTVQARLTQSASASTNPTMVQIAEEVESLIGELRDTTMNIRMLPIGSTFARFRRLIRDLAGTLGKDIRLVTEGEETELDKTVIERLSDPMVHLIRNSIDHGIEAPDVRETAGKARAGTIRLSAGYAGANVRISIHDDGKGLDVEAIRQKAVAKGLLSADSQASEQEIFSCIFQPGFSTAQKVTNLSGRGVGLDVVRRGIEDLRGKVEVSSKPGAGTTFTLELPLTLAIIEGLLVSAGGEVFVVPLSVVRECVELNASAMREEQRGNLIDIRGEIVPYIRLRDYFGIDGTSPSTEYVVIAESEGDQVGFAVDAVLGEYQTVIKSLGTMYRNVEGVSGATILGDGSVALIIDVPAIISSTQREQQNRQRLSRAVKLALTHP
jgi:two-component system, chemotaxis family, sensor kinase CheA